MSFSNAFYTLLCQLSTLVSLSLCVQGAQAEESLHLEQIKLPPGFTIEMFARVPNARAMSLGKNTLFVGSMRHGSVYAVELKKTAQKNGYRAGKTKRIISSLNLPAGVDFYKGDLYVSSIGQILRLKNIEQQLDAPGRPQVVIDDLPNNRWHGARYIRFSPDGWLYISVGAPCNVCESKDSGLILRMRPDGSERTVFARGIRNSVGFDWHPVDSSFWFSDNGRDMLGDDLPPGELNQAKRAGLHFGFPYCHAGSIPDPKFSTKRSCNEFVAPARQLGAHVAPLGLRFYTGRMFPKKYHNQIFIAEHGSWNRSKKSGYRITLVSFEAGQPPAYEPFATGWMENESFWGRPADLLTLPDGSLLISDDEAGAIYRVKYSVPESEPNS